MLSAAVLLALCAVGARAGDPYRPSASPSAAGAIAPDLGTVDFSHMEQPRDWPYEPQDYYEPPYAEKKGVGIPWNLDIPRRKDTKYFVVNGFEECQHVHFMMYNVVLYGPDFYTQCEGQQPEFLDLCHAMQAAFEDCPEYVNNWCYQDLGGEQRLLSPCPAVWKAHYCLGLNPLHCLPVDDGSIDRTGSRSTSKTEEAMKALEKKMKELSAKRMTAVLSNLMNGVALPTSLKVGDLADVEPEEPRTEPDGIAAASDAGGAGVSIEDASKDNLEDGGDNDPKDVESDVLDDAPPGEDVQVEEGGEEDDAAAHDTEVEEEEGGDDDAEEEEEEESED